MNSLSFLPLILQSTALNSHNQTFGRLSGFTPVADFVHGQLYAEISTTRDDNGLQIFVAGATNQGKPLEDIRTFTKNIGPTCRTFAVKGCNLMLVPCLKTGKNL